MKYSLMGISYQWHEEIARKYHTTTIRPIRGEGTFVLLKDDLIGIRQVELETICKITWIKFEITGCKVVYVASYFRAHKNDEHSLQELEKTLNLLKA